MPQRGTFWCALDGILARVDAVSSGEEAIAAVEQHDSGRPYDVIFMDWRMPGMDGIQAARLIKENTQLKTHPAVVLVTAFGREEVREEAERIQIDGFLLKPVTTSMLVDTLVTLFAGATQDKAVLAPEIDRHADRLRGLRVLLAEDNEINQQIAVELLEGVGATVEVANDGLEAVRKLLDQPMPPNYDVVLMDLQMPEMDGYQATSKIRSDPRFASFPIIAMTAHATIDERQKCLAAGMNGHVSKPIDPLIALRHVGALRRPNREGSCCAAREPAPTAVAEAGELPDVPGLNTEGLMRVAGNKKLYLNFCASSRKRKSMPPSVSPPPWQRMTRPGRAAGPLCQRGGRKSRRFRCSECGCQSGESHCGSAPRLRSKCGAPRLRSASGASSGD